ncbi:hypothetical protein K501DRAFT_276305 [Backusella circina FSU 941]|nr:hypothetical protein K501DRAFT_276305 [Backusella circina FSU 941]
MFVVNIEKCQSLVITRYTMLSEQVKPTSDIDLTTSEANEKIMNSSNSIKNTCKTKNQECLITIDYINFKDKNSIVVDDNHLVLKKENAKITRKKTEKVIVNQHNIVLIAALHA